MKTFESRFLRAFFAWVVVASVVGGGALALQYGHGLRKFGGLEYLPRIVGLNLVREVAGGFSFAAVLLAWVSVTHDLEPAATRRRFRQIATTTVIVFPFSELLGLALAFASSWGTCFFLYQAPLPQYWSSAVRILDGEDCLVAVEHVVISVLLVIPIGWLLAPRLAAVAWSLPRKAIAVWFALGAFRLLLSLAGSMANPDGSLHPLSPRPVSDRLASPATRDHWKDGRWVRGAFEDRSLCLPRAVGARPPWPLGLS